MAAGEVLVRAGETGSDAFWVESGELQATDDQGAVLAHLPAGSLIGEYAALVGAARSATLTAAQPSTVRVVPAALLESMLADDPQLGQVVRAEAVARLRATQARDALRAAFGPEAHEALGEVAALAELRRYDAGDQLLAGDTLPDELLVVVSGRLRRLDGAATAASVGYLGPGSVVSEDALVPGAADADGLVVEAVRDSVVAALPAPALRQMVLDRPRELAPAAMRMLAGRGTRHHELDRGVVVAVTAPSAAESFVDDLTSAMCAVGTTQAVSSRWVDATLHRPGIAQAPAGDPAEIRLLELLARVEKDACYLVLQPDADDSEWSRRVLREGDVLALVASPDPDAAEQRRVEALLAGAGPRTLRVLVLLHPPGTQRPRGTGDVMTRWGVDHVLHLRADTPADLHRVARVLAGRPRALVMGGGGGKAMASLGVFQAMTEVGLPVDVVAGTSMGSICAAAIAQALEPAVLVDAGERLMGNLLDYTIPVVSLLKGERAARAIAAQFGGWDVEDLWLPFFCVSTNLTRGREHVHRRGDLVTALRASTAVPGAFPPVPDGDDLLVDGGVTNNLPVDVLRRLYPTAEVVAVEGAPAMGPRARSDFGLSVSGWQALRASVGHRKTYPGVMAVLMRSMITGSMHQRDAVVASGAVDLLLGMDLRGVGLMEFHRVREVARMGYEQAMPLLEQWGATRGQSDSTG